MMSNFQVSLCLGQRAAKHIALKIRTLSMSSENRLQGQVARKIDLQTFVKFMKHEGGLMAQISLGSLLHFLSLLHPLAQRGITVLRRICLVGDLRATIPINLLGCLEDSMELCAYAELLIGQVR